MEDKKDILSPVVSMLDKEWMLVKDDTNARLAFIDKVIDTYYNMGVSDALVVMADQIAEVAEDHKQHKRCGLKRS